MTRRTGERGFTLIELMVTVVVIGILAAVAIPSFRTTILSNRLSTVANEFVAALGQARVEAVRHNAAALYCGVTGNGSDTLGTGCTAAGMVRALDSNGAAITARASPTIPSGTTLVSGTPVRFSSQGIGRAIGATTPYTGLVMDLNASDLSGNNRRCIYLVTGSIVSTCTVSGSSPCPSNEPTPCQ